MKLSISNIVWPRGRQALPGFLDAAAAERLPGVELALNAIFEEPGELPDGDLSWLLAELRARRLAVSALHSLTFTRPDLELFGEARSRRALQGYLLRYAQLAAALGCGNMVFGSPGARRRHGRAKPECDELLLEFLGGFDAASPGVRLNIEPLAPAMCEYLHTLEECSRLLAQGRFRQIGIQLDVRSCIENEEGTEEIRAVLPQVHHCQVSDPGLTPIGEAHAEQHRQAASLLRDTGYAGFVAGEMCAPRGATPEQALRAAVASLREYYS